MSSFPNNDPSREKNRNRERMTEEAAICNTFALIIRNKFSSRPQPDAHTSDTSGNHHQNDLEAKLERLEEMYQSPLYEAEQKIIRGMSNNGFGKGLLCGLGTFVFFRRGPRLISRYMVQKTSQSGNRNGMSGGRSNSYTFDNLNHPVTASGSANSAREAATTKPHIIFRIFKFGLDLFVSTNVAMYASTYFTDKSKLIKEMSNIPLVEGKSMISDELCDDFIDVYRHIPKKVWDKYESKEREEDDIATEVLTSIGNFVKNCHRRHIRENELLDENRAFGDIKNEDEIHPPIPPPGVSPDIAVEIEWGDKSEDVLVGKEPEEDDFYGFVEDSHFENYSDDDDDDSTM